MFKRATKKKLINCSINLQLVRHVFSKKKRKQHKETKARIGCSININPKKTKVSFLHGLPIFRHYKLKNPWYLYSAFLFLLLLIIFLLSLSLSLVLLFVIFFPFSFLLFSFFFLLLFLRYDNCIYLLVI